MNEAKKKADELVRQHEEFASRYSGGLYDASWLNECAVQASLITVNEVLKARPVYPSLKNYTVDCMREAKEFWQAVKEELESRL